MFKYTLSFIVVAGLVLAMVPATQAAIIVPTGLGVGDTYHLVFVSSTKRDATSDDRGVYDTHVQNAANAAGIGTSESVSWVAIVTTDLSGDAKDRFAVASPIYLVDGTTKVKDSYALLWADEELDARITMEEDGTTVVDSEDWGDENMRVWSGTAADGTAKLALGSGGDCRAGNIYPENPARPDWSKDDWIDAHQKSEDDLYRVYGISEELTVPIPEPSTFALAAFGLLGLAFCGWRRKR